MTRQEMFDRAVRGLRTQRFHKAVEYIHGKGSDDGEDDVITRCVYLDPEGNRCAWGHVDPSLGPNDEGSVHKLREIGRGLAATLSPEDLRFAAELQSCHDESESARDMEERLRDLAEYHGLAWPAEETKK